MRASEERRTEAALSDGASSSAAAVGSQNIPTVLCFTHANRRENRWRFVIMHVLGLYMKSGGKAM